MNKQILISLVFTLATSQSTFTMEAPNDLNRRLVIAAYKGNLKEVQKLIALGADPNAPTTIIPHLAAAADYNQLSMNDLGERLIKEHDVSALVWAIEGSHEAVCKFLLDHGADPNSTLNEKSTTPLMWAAQNYWDDPKFCRLLLRYGADIKKKTVLAEAAKKGNIRICAFLLENGADGVEHALGCAAGHGKYEICRFLLGRGVDVNARIAQATPLLLAAKWTRLPRHSRSTTLAMTPLFTTLLEADAGVNDQDADGNTPLMLITDYFLPKEQLLLLEYGADPRIQNKAGDTAIMISARKRFPNHPRYEEHILWPLIANPIFNPICSRKQIQESRNRILAALLVFKRICPLMPRDLRRFVLLGQDELRQDLLYAGACGIRENLAADVPLQTVRALINSGRWDKHKAISVIKAHHYACIKPLMLKGLLCTTENTPEMQALLNPNTAEKTYDAHIERNINRRLGMRGMGDWVADAVEPCTIQ